MKSTKWILRVLATSTFFAVHAHAASQTVDGRTWAYSVSGGAAKVTGVNQASGAVVIPSSLGGYPVTSIGTNAFFNCSEMTSVVIPDSVTSIDILAFQKCSGLTSLTIPKKVARIGSTAFAMCTFLSSIKVASGNANYESKDGVLFNKGKTKLCCCPAGKDDGYSIPGSVTEIGDNSFMYCGNLTSLTIPDSVKVIGESAFYSCQGLVSVRLGNGLSTIAGGAFVKCYSLASLVIPASVTSLGQNVFYRCDGLNSLYVPESWESKYVDGTYWSAYAAVPTGCTVVYSRLELAASSRTFTAAAASSKEVGVTANVSWAAKSSASWLTVKKASGNGNGTVVYDVAANTGTASRTGKITVTGGGITRTFTVTQNGVEAKLELGAGERTFTAAAASSKELSVTANVSWTAKSSASWLTVKTASGTGNGTIVYDMAANTGAARTGTITVAGGGISRTFTVQQEGKTVTLELGASERTFTAAAANSKEVSVTANVSWTAKSSASWLTLKTTAGSGDGTIVYNVAANTGTGARTATITVTGGGITRTYTVTQSGTAATLVLAESERSFAADAANGRELGVTADVSWTAESSAAWLTVKTASGTGNGTIAYDVAANPGTAERTATITVTGGGVTRTFTATQSGQAARLELGESARTFTADAASGNVAVSANVPWTAASSASWLAVRTPDGTGDGVVAYDVAENPGTGERMGAITVSGSGLTRNFLVTQGGKTETQRTPVGVPCLWLEENAAGILAANGGDHEAAAMALAANGLPVWKCYVAGLSTTDKDAQFKVKSISLADGEPELEWTPDLSENGTKTNRAYVIQGKHSMDDAWAALTPSSRFFRVTVQLPSP